MPFEKYITARFIDDTGNAFVFESPSAEGAEVEIPFKVDKTHKKDPDSLEITLVNLSKGTRERIKSETTTVELYAGFDPGPGMLFKGEVNDVSVQKDKDFVNWETIIFAKDTKSALRTRIFSKSYGAGTPLDMVFRDLANAGTLQPDFSLTGKLSYPLTLFGPVRDAVQTTAGRLGYRSQIVDHRLVIREEDEPTNTTTVPVISGPTGLIGIPSARLEKKVVKVDFSCSINRDLVPGGLCVLRTLATTGTRKAPLNESTTLFIEQITHSNSDKGLTSNVSGRVRNV